MEEEAGRGQGGAGEAQVRLVHAYVQCKHTEEFFHQAKCNGLHFLLSLCAVLSVFQ